MADGQQKYNRNTKDKVLLSWTATFNISISFTEKKDVNPFLPERHTEKYQHAINTTFMLLKNRICIKENLHTDTWKSELHFEEDVPDDTIQNPDLFQPVFSIVLWLNNDFY